MRCCNRLSRVQSLELSLLSLLDEELELSSLSLLDEELELSLGDPREWSPRVLGPGGGDGGGTWARS